MNASEKREPSFHRPIDYLGERLPWTLRVSSHALERAQRRFDGSIEHGSIVVSTIESLYYRLIIPCKRNSNQWWIPIRPKNAAREHVLMWACAKLDSPIAKGCTHHLTVSTIFDDQYDELRATLRDVGIHPEPARALFDNRDRIRKGENPIAILREEINERYGSKEIRPKRVNLDAFAELPPRVSEVYHSHAAFKRACKEKGQQGYEIARIVVSYEKE